MQEPARDFESVTSVYVLITWGSCDCPVTIAKTGRDRDAAVEESLRTSFTHETSFAVRLFCPNYPALPATFLEKPRSRHTHRTTTSGWCYDFSSFHISDTFSGELNIINVFEILTYKSQTIFRESQSLSFFKNLFERLVFLILFFFSSAFIYPLRFLLKVCDGVCEQMRCGERRSGTLCTEFFQCLFLGCCVYSFFLLFKKSTREKRP